ncbi:bile acid:sodium symporter family protein [Herbidospora sp. RD11066]
MDSPLILGSLPFAIGVLMLGLGLNLTIDDFRRVARFPKAVALALLCQVLLLPVICFALVLAFRLPPEPAVGLMLVAASPGGPIANLLSHLFGGNVALNITLTAINSVLAVVTLPIVVNLSSGYFLSGGAAIGLQAGKLQQIFLMVIVPVVTGMLVRALAPKVAGRLDLPVRVFSIVVLLTVVASVLYAERDNLAGNFAVVGLAVLAFNVVSLVVGYGVPRLAGVDHGTATASGFEIGIHNTALAVAIALSPDLLNSSEIAVPGAVYGIIQVFTAAAFGALIKRPAAP